MASFIEVGERTFGGLWKWKVESEVEGEEMDGGGVYFSGGGVRFFLMLIRKSERWRVGLGLSEEEKKKDEGVSSSGLDSSPSFRLPVRSQTRGAR